MYEYSERSLKNLESCDRHIKFIMLEVIKRVDCYIIWGHRGQEEQDIAFHSGYSKLKYPDSKHNVYPSQAIDVIPYPSGWDKERNFYFLAGQIFAIAYIFNIDLRWGGDFNCDRNFYNDRWLDLGHFEIVGKRNT